MDLFLSNIGMPEPPFPQDEEVSPSNPFLEEEEASRRDARTLERALDMLMVTTSRRCPRESASPSFLLSFLFSCLEVYYFHNSARQALCQSVGDSLIDVKPTKINKTIFSLFYCL